MHVIEEEWGRGTSEETYLCQDGWNLWLKNVGLF